VTVAVVTFPGSNCDRDVRTAIERGTGAAVAAVWHKDAALPSSTKAVVLPGGFSYGDYLRCGAMAARSPIMGAVKRFAEAGGPVLGICNGFQILCEAKLLEGTLLKNRAGSFRCEPAPLVVEQGGAGLLAGYAQGQAIELPIAHGEGNYFADDETIAKLEREGRVAFRYAQRDARGFGAQNGSKAAIAGVLGGPKKNVLGLMPHPERRAEARLGGGDGLPLLRGLIAGASS
jgi:phosphoribosylformylglycinamidine synthase subunit PurQ / glutaminase